MFPTNGIQTGEDFVSTLQSLSVHWKGLMDNLPRVSSDIDRDSDSDRRARQTEGVVEQRQKM
jgi:hypothetical protein